MHMEYLFALCCWYDIRGYLFLFILLVCQECTYLKYICFQVCKWLVFIYVVYCHLQEHLISIHLFTATTYVFTYVTTYSFVYIACLFSGIY